MTATGPGAPAPGEGAGDGDGDRRRDERTATWARAGVFGFLSGITTDFATGIVGDWVPPTPLTFVVMGVVGLGLALSQASPAPEPTPRDPPGLGVGARLRLWRRARVLAGTVRRAERVTPPVVLVALDGPSEGWAPGGRAAAWFEAHAEALADVIAEARLEPECAALRGVAFRAARALCSWQAADPARRDAWRATLAEVAALARGHEHQAIGRWHAVQQGIVARLDGRHDDAIDALTKALPTRGNWADAQVHTNLGLAHLGRGGAGDLDAAVRHLERAQRHRARRDRAGWAVTDLALAEAYRARGRRDDEGLARDRLANAARLLDALGEPTLAAAVHRSAVRPRPPVGPGSGPPAGPAAGPAAEAGQPAAG